MFSSFARSRESANSEINGLIYTNLELCIQFNLKIRGISQWWWCAMCKRLTNLSINLLRVNYNFLHQINFSVGKKNLLLRLNYKEIVLRASEKSSTRNRKKIHHFHGSMNFPRTREFFQLPRNSEKTIKNPKIEFTLTLIEFSIKI